jgi:small subunit ribosomal protein S4e
MIKKEKKNSHQRKKQRINKMVKNHIKRITAPRTWNVNRKTTKFITKPFPGAHKLEQAMAINTFLKELAKLTNTTKETKYVLTNDEVLVNGKRRRDFKAQVGFLDIITIKSINKHYLITIDKKGALKPKEINEKESTQRVLKINKKTILAKDNVQINTMNGENLLVKEKEAQKYKIGDTLIVEVKNLKIIEHIPLKEKQLVFVYTGKHSSKTGTLEAINQKTVTIKTSKESFETSKDYLIALNKEKIVEFE